MNRGHKSYRSAAPLVAAIVQRHIAYSWTGAPWPVAMWALVSLIQGALPEPIAHGLTRLDDALSALVGPAWAPTGSTLFASLAMVLLLATFALWNALKGRLFCLRRL